MIDRTDAEDDVVELEWADEDVEPDDAGDELAPAEWPDAADEEVEQVSRDGFEGRRVILPQPERARSNPDLPRVKASAFKRFIA